MEQQRLAPHSHFARGSIRTLSLLVTAVAGVFSCTCSTASMSCVFLEGQRTRHTLISVNYTIEPLPAEVGNRIQYISVVTVETSSTITTRYARCTAARLTTHSARQPLNVYIVSIPHHSCHVCVPSIRGSGRVSPRPRKGERREVKVLRELDPPLSFASLLRSHGAKEWAVMPGRAPHVLDLLTSQVVPERPHTTRTRTTRACGSPRGAPLRAACISVNEQKKVDRHRS